MGPPAGPRTAMHMPDPKEVFKKLDRDGDGKLSLEEFTAGMKRFHETMMAKHRPPKPEKPAKPEKPEKPEPGAKPQAKEKA